VADALLLERVQESNTERMLENMKLYVEGRLAAPTA
jgi:hypothetical protein